MKFMVATTTVGDGNMSYVWGEKDDVGKNRNLFLKKVGIKESDCVYTKLRHEADVLMVGREDKGKTMEADGFITTDKNVAIFMLTGDCLPVVYFDKQKCVLGIAHLGWRGVDKELAGKMVESLVKLGCEPKNLRVWIGPGVRKETYWKYDKGVSEFKNSVDVGKWGMFMEDKPDGQLALDLVGFVKHQVLERGVMEKNIDVSSIDTVADLNYFSQFRSDKLGQPQGRFATVVIMQ